jgi:hypothetical protein
MQHTKRNLRNADSIEIPLNVFTDEHGLPFQLYEIMRAAGSLYIPATVTHYYWTIQITHDETIASGLFDPKAEDPWQIVRWRNNELLHLFKNLESGLSGGHLWNFSLIGSAACNMVSRYSSGPKRTMDSIVECWLACERDRMIDSQELLDLPGLADHAVPLERVLGPERFREAKERMPTCDLDVGVLFRLCTDETCIERHDPYSGWVDSAGGCVKNRKLIWVPVYQKETEGTESEGTDAKVIELPCTPAHGLVAQITP